MEDLIFEQAFSDVTEFLTISDRRTKESKNEMVLAKQEFLSHVQELAEEWFDKRVKIFRNI